MKSTWKKRSIGPERIRAALTAARGNLSGAAQALGVNRSTVNRWISSDVVADLMSSKTDNPCEKCGGSIYAVLRQDGRPRKRRFCSDKCSRNRPRRARYRMSTLRKKTDKLCENCGGPVYALVKSDGKPRKRRFCDHWRCRGKSSRRQKPQAVISARSVLRRTGTCSECGVVFVAKTKDRLKYCGRPCACVARRRARRTDKARRDAPGVDALNSLFLNHFLLQKGTS